MDYGFIPNLHVILLGDSQRAGAYLPYGKQLVRQLLASRQPYGKRVGRPESGITVEAWVSGDHRWVRVIAEGCGPFLMESGIIGLQNVGLQVLHLNDGLIHYNTAIRTYATDKKLLGMLTKLPATDSRPTTELHPTPAVSAEVDEEGKRDVDSETLLGLKKFCAARVPPSVFTGKLRLYFQAHYGKLLRNWNFRANLANHPPSLDWDTKLGEADYTFQFHSAHTGIFTDSKKRHWLVQLGVKGAHATPNQANVFKMRTIPCIEAMRPTLLDPNVSDDDKERIEAYILAASYPDPEFCISKPVSIPVSLNLGYGWHFNWGGTDADIVHIETISTGGATYKHRSTHYRINIARHDEYVDDPTNTELENEARRWTFELQQVEQKDWKNTKWGEVIASPDWSNGQLEIFGQQWGDRYGDGAPIYCFYTRDTLKVVRYSRSGGGSTVYYRKVSSPGAAYGETGWVTCTLPPTDPVVLGLSGVVYGNLTRTGDPTSTRFSVDGVSVGGDYESHSGTIVEYTEKVRNYNDAYFAPGYYGSSAAVAVGDAAENLIVSGSGACAVEHWGYSGIGHATTFIGPGDIAGSWYIGVNYGVTTYTRSYASSVKLLCVVPFGDAEAVYLWGSKHEVTTDDGTVESRSKGLQTLIKINKVNGAEASVSYNYYGVDDNGGHATVSSSDYHNVTDVTSQLGALFVSGCGVQTFVPEAVVSAFFAGEPNTHVAQDFWTRTSAGIYRDTDGSGVALTGGYDQVLNSKPYVFSGWA